MYSSYVCDLVCFALLLLFLFVFFLRYDKGESGVGPALIWGGGQLTSLDASPCVGIPHYFILFGNCPPCRLPSFFFRCVAHSLSLSISSCLGCLALLIWLPFLRSLLRRMFFLPYAYYLWLSFVDFAVVCLLLDGFLV